MTVESLMTETVELLTTTGEDRDAIGGSTPTDSSTSVSAYLEPVSGKEDEANRNTEEGQWLAFLPAGTAITGWDRLSYGARLFDLIAPPRPMYNPRVGSVSHIEADLREVE